jgi:hypothetical protein
MNEPNDSGNMKDIPKGFAERFVELNNNIDNIQAKSVSELYGTERTKNKTNLEKEGGSKLMQCKIQITAYNDLTKFVDSKGEDMFLPTIIKTGNVIPSDIQNMMREFMHWLSEDNFLYNIRKFLANLTYFIKKKNEIMIKEDYDLDWKNNKFQKDYLEVAFQKLDISCDETQFVYLINMKDFTMEIYTRENRNVKSVHVGCVELLQEAKGRIGNIH